MAIDTTTRTVDWRKAAAERVSVFSNAALIATKLVVALHSGSVSVLAEAVHSSGDFVGALISLFSVKIADTPPDSDHEFGHGKFENISGVAIAILVACAGCWAAFEAVEHLRHHVRMASFGPAVGVMGLSCVVDFFVSRHLLKVGLETNSPAVLADGRHLQTDVFTSLAVFVGLLGARLTHWPWVDPVIALGISILILSVSVRLTRDALAPLSDAALPEFEVKQLRHALEADPRVLGFHNLRTRKSGSQRHVDVHVQISDTHSFVDAHNVSEELEELLRHALPNVNPIIHVEPFEAEAQHQASAHQRELQDARGWRVEEKHEE